MGKSNRNMIIVSILVIIAFVIIISLVVIKINKPKKIVDIEEQDTYEAKQTIERVSSRNKYYAVDGIVKSYIESAMLRDGTTLYDILQPKYKEDFSITNENVTEKISSQHQLDENEVTVFIDEMFIYEYSANINYYFIYGYTRNNVTSKITSFKIIIEINSEEKAYYIIPTDGVEKLGYGTVNEGQELVNDFDTEINKNENNVFSGYLNILDDVIVTDYMNRYKEYLTYNKEKAYDMLEEEYRNKRFGNFEEFQKYLTTNISKLFSATINKYAIDKNDDITIYVGVDQGGNYYVFKENSVMNYELMLDIYTIPLQENLETYKSANEQEKVAMNINKWVMAMNSQDYKYMYGALNETFKRNNFATIEEFEKYAKEKFYLSSNLEFRSYSLEGTTYIYEIKLTNKYNSEISYNMNIMMKLDENNNFEMSFEI